MRVSYLLIAVSVMMVFGVAYALAAEEEYYEADLAIDNAVDSVAVDEEALEADDLGLFGEDGEDLTGAADDSGADAGDKLKRAHDDTTDLGGCGY